MTIARRKTKVKKKKKAVRRPKGPARPASKRKKRASGKTKRAPKRPTRAQLERELAKAKRALARARKKKRQRPEPGTLLSPRSEAARRGWTTRRLKKAQSVVTPAGRPVDTSRVIEEFQKRLTPDQLEDIEFFERPEVQKQLRDLYIKKMPELFLEGTEYLERPEPQIMAQLIQAEIRGNFQEVAYRLAEETGYEANEIYGFFHGYALPEQ